MNKNKKNKANTLKEIILDIITIFIVALVIATILILVVFIMKDISNHKQIKNEENYDTIANLNYNLGISTFQDPDTGVHYLIYKGPDYCAMAPRLNPDGLLYIGKNN